jgi:Rrf2 family protein
MKITAQEEYGLRCLLRLARAAPDYPLGIREIAEAEGLSTPYVAKLMAALRQAGLIESVRGRAGGYRLALAPREVRLGSLLLAVGEPLFDDPGYCRRHAGTEANGCCVHHGGCSLRALWQTLEQWMRAALDQMTLADLLLGEGEIVELLRRRLAETTSRGSPALVPLPVLTEEQMATAGQGGKSRKRSPKPKGLVETGS